ncbi:unnamed protein product [Toxocara canis]|uniref:Nas2_N domain-containing protein n=1 Tax=Toxocara canis TaxID=6265 RepID=A0A183VHL1_TOXCA|nr:unnamed protein product [Toxocara canis]
MYITQPAQNSCCARAHITELLLCTCVHLATSRELSRARAYTTELLSCMRVHHGVAVAHCVHHAASKELGCRARVYITQLAENWVALHNGVDMHSSLIDSEGFPLANVDVYSVPHARQAVIGARDDRQKLTDRIEALMHELHAITKQERPSPKR